MAKVANTALFEWEKSLRRPGCEHIAGVDEVGRGSLAGPVVAAAVVLKPEFYHPELNDSKLVNPLKRRELAECILSGAVSWAIGVVGAEVIDAIGILPAQLKAMYGAVRRLTPLPDYVLVDAVRIPELDLPQEAIVKGDRRCASIAAASILAKVFRDNLMKDYDALYPQYGFGEHKGYATSRHREMLARYGPCPIHRASFAPVKGLFCRPM